MPSFEDLSWEQIKTIARADMLSPDNAALLLARIATTRHVRDADRADQQRLAEVIDPLISVAAQAPPEYAGKALYALLWTHPIRQLIPLLRSTLQDPATAAFIVGSMGVRFNEIDRDPDLHPLADELIAAAARAPSDRASFALTSLLCNDQEPERLLALARAVQCANDACSVVSRLTADRLRRLYESPFGRAILATLADVAARDDEQAASFMRSLIVAAPFDQCLDLALMCAANAARAPFGTVKALAVLGRDRLCRIQRHPAGGAIIDAFAATAVSGEPWHAARALVALAPLLTSEQTKALVDVIVQKPDVAADALIEIAADDLRAMRAAAHGAQIIDSLVIAAEGADPTLAAKAFAAMLRAMAPDDIRDTDALLPLVRAMQRCPTVALAALEAIGEQQLRSVNATPQGRMLLDELLDVATRAPERAAPSMSLLASVFPPDQLQPLIAAIALDPNAANNALISVDEGVVRAWCATPEGVALLNCLLDAGVKQADRFPMAFLARALPPECQDMIVHAIASAPALDDILGRVSDPLLAALREGSNLAQRTSAAQRRKG